MLTLNIVKFQSILGVKILTFKWVDASGKTIKMRRILMR